MTETVEFAYREMFVWSIVVWVDETVTTAAAKVTPETWWEYETYLIVASTITLAIEAALMLASTTLQHDYEEDAEWEDGDALPGLVVLSATQLTATHVSAIVRLDPDVPKGAGVASPEGDGSLRIERPFLTDHES